MVFGLGLLLHSPLIEMKTAPADFRFPKPNQALLYSGEESYDCGRFAKYYLALCHGEWVEKWNEQRESETSPGLL